LVCVAAHTVPGETARELQQARNVEGLNDPVQRGIDPVQGPTSQGLDGAGADPDRTVTGRQPVRVQDIQRGDQVAARRHLEEMVAFRIEDPHDAVTLGDVLRVQRSAPDQGYRDGTLRPTRCRVDANEPVEQGNG